MRRTLLSGVAQHAQVSSPTDLVATYGRFGGRRRAGRLADQVRQGQQVVLGGSRLRVVSQSNDIPSPRCAEALAVELTQVIGMGFGVRREWAEDGGLVGVHIGERGHRGTPAGGTGAAAQGTHGPEATAENNTVGLGSRCGDRRAGSQAAQRA